MNKTQIEYPSSGATYNNDEYGVYQYSVYPRSSVLAGQTRRMFIDSFKTLDEACKEYPAAVITGSCYQPPYLGHLPDDSDY